MKEEKRGKFLAQCRKEKKISQEQLGELLNYSKSNISKWENGQSFPNDPEILMKMAKILDISVEEIIFGDKKNKNNNQNLIDSLIDEYKEKYTNFKKISINLTLSFFTIIMLIVFIIYYVFIRGSISIYKLSFEFEDFYMEDAVLVTSNSISTLNFNKIVSNSENIEYIKLYYFDKENDEVLIFGGKNDDYFLEEDNGYNEYGLLNINKNELYLDIKTNQNDYKRIKVTCNRRYINNNIFPRKSASISNDDKSFQNEIDLKILLNYGFKSEDDYFYYKNFSDAVYITVNSERIHVLIENNNDIYETIRTNYDDDNIVYTKIENNNVSTEETFMTDEEINCDKSKCTDLKDWISYINFIKKIVKK